MMRNKSLFYGTRCIFCNTKHMTLRTFKNIYGYKNHFKTSYIRCGQNFINGVVIKHWYHYILHSWTHISICSIVRMPFASSMKIIFLMLYCYNKFQWKFFCFNNQITYNEENPMINMNNLFKWLVSALYVSLM